MLTLTAEQGTVPSIEAGTRHFAILLGMVALKGLRIARLNLQVSAKAAFEAMLTVRGACTMSCSTSAVSKRAKGPRRFS